MTDQPIEIPPEFWQTISAEELTRIAYEQDSCLNADQCRRLWRLTGRKTEPPTRMLVELNMADVQRIWPQPKKRWIKIPGPGEFRGEGLWLLEPAVRTFEGDWLKGDAAWDYCRSTGYLPTHEGDDPPEGRG
jgi:hypothetical protein